MTYLTCDYYSEASSIADGGIDTPFTSDFEEVDVNDLLSLNDSETEDSTEASALYSRPRTPLNHGLSATQREWEGLCTKYHQGIQHLRDIEDQMFRYQALHPCLCINYQNPMLCIQRHQRTKDRNNNIQQTVDSLGASLENNISSDLSPESHHLKVKLNNAVEVSVVTLDTLTGKKTMISLTTRSTMKHVEQLLGFWEYDLPMDL
ncbi:hypothetical protein IWW34DRAFT_819635 [Fusarium oxysporum f. sp. albedinis]|uniref:Uncharacterized protein n=1 Tax=Fusarium oxysporum f. sp. narcissi TaxID=451672 RepID=A0A4Q2VBY2_FUSOX|nr:hypothetical protein FOWG_16019 [Fusarium oxysporum f. sp. lycopersici MN25]KAI3580642.1 hypothetical protein IWW34DRAFT_819635 [Fusarium oxysporum f. sp. albedinis]KAJ0155376.1 Uncharacterized protein HZ326_2271 [Fusarium oxysporum f. sp. albedinis]KAK2471586.1 hypothetical protein H9L39_16879 [Fusarium oxysporum f. sp. albedinis]RYC81517.1 hypothetical protein BFJ63_vAg15588 [Fusarium oxysporum f. sp. narcissi]